MRETRVLFLFMWLGFWSPAASYAETGGPDAFGYRYLDNQGGDTATFAWIELCGDSLATNGPTGHNNVTCFFLGWNFPFYGLNHTYVCISTNGLISFGGAHSSPSNVCATGGEPFWPRLAVYWDDLFASSVGGCQEVVGPWVRYRDFGEYLAIEWKRIQHYPSSADRFTFQALLYPDGKIKCQYHTDWVAPMNPNSATVGTDALGPGNGLDYVCDGVPASNQIGADGRAVWFYQPPTSPPCCEENPELEPNNHVATANPLPLTPLRGCAQGFISDSLDVDLFLIEIPLPARLTATVHAHGDSGYCGYNLGLDAAVALLYPWAGELHYLEADHHSGSNGDPLLSPPYCLDPGTCYLAVGRDAVPVTIGPYLLEVELFPLPPPPLSGTPEALTIQKTDTALWLRWVPMVLATHYRIESSSGADGPWTELAVTDDARWDIGLSLPDDRRFYRVAGIAPNNVCFSVQDFVGTHIYPPEDSLELFPFRVDSIMLTAHPGGEPQVAYLVGTFAGPIPPGYAARGGWDGRQQAFAKGERNIVSLSGYSLDVAGELEQIRFARVQAGSNGAFEIFPRVSTLPGGETKSHCGPAHQDQLCGHARGLLCVADPSMGFDCPNPRFVEYDTSCVQARCTYQGLAWYSDLTFACKCLSYSTNNLCSSGACEVHVRFLPCALNRGCLPPNHCRISWAPDYGDGPIAEFARCECSPDE